MGALDGIRVVDISRLLPGPYCSMVLADHGAEVIAIEDRRFEADDLYFSDVYRNKKHMTLNLKSEEGKKIFFALVEEADIVVEGFRPGVVERLGVGYEEVKRRNPAIIYCAITGYGQEGEASQMAGHDVNYLSRAGILNAMGEADRPPTIPAVQIGDVAGGGLNAVVGILLALHERNRSGQGQYIDISMTDGLLGLLALPNVLRKKTGREQQRSSSMLSHRYACYNTYETAGNRYFSLGAVENRFWRNLCIILELEEYVPLQYDESRRREIIDTLRRIFRQKPLQHWEATLAGADVCYSAIQNMDEVFADPRFIERDMVVATENGDGLEKTFGVPVKLGRTPGTIRHEPPPFGGTTRDVLAELGYSPAEIEKLYEQGVV
jgi:crotonobetainyl-CoA:carnitine CoA-transferase CaiB-like acyl-CoA transferase